MPISRSRWCSGRLVPAAGGAAGGGLDDHGLRAAIFFSHATIFFAFCVLLGVTGGSVGGSADHARAGAGDAARRMVYPDRRRPAAPDARPAGWAGSLPTSPIRWPSSAPTTTSSSPEVATRPTAGTLLGGGGGEFFCRRARRCAGSWARRGIRHRPWPPRRCWPRCCCWPAVLAVLPDLVQNVVNPGSG